MYQNCQILLPSVYNGIVSGTFELPADNMLTFVFCADNEIAVSDNLRSIVCPKGNFAFFLSSVPYSINAFGNRICIIRFKIVYENRLPEPSDIVISDDKKIIGILLETSMLFCLSGARYDFLLRSQIYKLISTDILYKESDVQDIYPGIKKLENEFLENSKIAEYAKLCNMSDNKFRSVFTSFFGISPIEYRNKLRLERARELMERMLLPVSEAAAASGFASVSYFCRLYKKTYGVTPGTGKGEK